MTVLLTFDEDPQLMSLEARRYRSSPSDDTNAGVLAMSWFRLPTRFAVDNVELLSDPPRAAPRVAVLGLAFDLPRALARAADEGAADVTVFGPDNVLDIRRSEGGLRLQMRGSESWANASWAELESAAAEFATRVREYLLQFLPDLARDGDLASWFAELKGDRDPNI